MQKQDQQLWGISNVYHLGADLSIRESETLNGLQAFLGQWCVSFDPSTMQLLEWFDVAIETNK